VAAALRKEPGLDVEVVNGDKGEFTVLVDNHPVACKTGEKLPSVQDILAAVTTGSPATIT
jgi:hypothetical protein